MKKIGIETIVLAMLSFALLAQISLATEQNINTPWIYENRSENLTELQQGWPIVESLNVSAGGKNITSSEEAYREDTGEEVDLGETVTVMFVIKNRKVARNLTIAWRDDIERTSESEGTETVTLEPEKRFGYTGSYTLKTPGMHRFIVYIDWIDNGERGETYASQPFSVPAEILDSRINSSINATADELIRYNFLNLSVGEQLALIEMMEKSADLEYVNGGITRKVNATMTEKVSAAYQQVEKKVDEQSMNALPGTSPERQRIAKAADMGVILTRVVNAYEAFQVLPQSDYDKLTNDEKKALRQMLKEFMKDKTINRQDKPAGALAVYDELEKNARKRTNETVFVKEYSGAYESVYLHMMEDMLQSILARAQITGTAPDKNVRASGLEIVFAIAAIAIVAIARRYRS